MRNSFTLVVGGHGLGPWTSVLSGQRSTPELPAPVEEILACRQLICYPRSMSLPVAYLHFSGKILLYIVYQFSLPHHLETFFSPFKRMALSSNRPGFHLDEVVQVLSFNLISRAMGILLRSIVMFMAVVLLATTLVGLIVLFPFILLLTPLVGSLQLARAKSEQDQLNKLISLATTTPGKTLKQIFTKNPLGIFTAQKLAISPQEVNELSTSTEAFSLPVPPNSLEELLIAYGKNFTPLKAFLVRKGIDEKDLIRIFDWFHILHPKENIFHLETDALKKIRGFGASWSYGYANELRKFQITQSWSQFPSVVGREKEINEIDEALSKTSHNSVLVVGLPGVGRHAIVDEVARRIYRGQVSPALAGMQIIYLDLKKVLATFPNISEGRQMISNLFDEGTQAGNMILVIDELDKYLETSGERIDITDLLAQHLASGKLRIIGLTSQDNYNRYVAQNPDMLKLFTIVTIPQPDMETVYEAMEINIVPVLSFNHKVDISYVAIKKAITNADRFISNVPFPEKAINLLDEAIIFTKRAHRHMKSLWDNDIELYLSKKTNIPIGDLTSDNKDKLANLESSLHQRVIGQDEALSALAKALRRSVMEISDPRRPIGSFLFLGPTGVGKTETAKALAALYFGSESRLVRFDMSQYQGEDGLTKLIGSKLTNSPGQLTTSIANNPFSILLLDEIEKAQPMVLNLFLTLLDEGYLTDAFGHQVSAKQMIIIGTSNAGALFIKNQVLSGNDQDLDKKLIEFIQQERIFSPEFLNRFDAVVVFKPLTFEQIREVTQLILSNLQHRLAQKQITVSFSPQTIERIITEGYDPAFGARSIKRYVQDVVEDEISRALLGSPQDTTIAL